MKISSKKSNRDLEIFITKCYNLTIVKQNETNKKLKTRKKFFLITRAVSSISSVSSVTGTVVRSNGVVAIGIDMARMGHGRTLVNI